MHDQACPHLLAAASCAVNLKECGIVVINAVMMVKQHAIVRAFERAAATTAGTACGPDQLGLKQGMAWYQLVQHAVLRCPGEGRYFLDRANWQRLRKRRQRVALGIAAILLGLLALLLFMRQG
ncbi:hypothetical protein PY254_00675 [Rhodanobacter sp. AS-Z3]|uniref:hypothetical protein n=1 Tax=Rhodanobacter sp. AS-Z3 TaxID=3031330 RepID=UPI002479DBDC|nr:hypothetical protein [Rhodanobacter sp. AS-Z3]WEN15229.1 hypothetical protein PY254_00675 [Rhodanobacter sp. AS-Z3]